MPLDRLALSRSTVDRAAARRTEPGLLDRLLADPGTAVLLVRDGRAPVTGDGGRARLHLLTGPDAARLAPDRAAAAYLGEGADGVAHLLLGLPADDDDPVLPAGGRWAGLREVGVLLDDTDAGLLTAGVALAGWHLAHPRCSRCGAPTDVVQAGWSRSCPSCGAEHYPRTDPAVIMTVEGADGRILLGRQAVWPEKRFSTLAGFVEPGESLEAAVRREVAEEAGVLIGDVTYRGSQPWPFPTSLMVGFRATALSAEIEVDGEELSEARWWSREAFGVDVRDGRLLLPPSVSIARRLIEDWYGSALPDAGEAWR